MIGDMFQKNKIVIAYEKNGEEESRKSWGSDFQYFLSVLLNQILGQKPDLLYLNPHAKGMDTHVDEAMIFLALLTDASRVNESLLGMCDRFAKRMQSQNQLNPGGKYSFMKIHSLPMKNLQALSFAAPISPYNFYDIDTLTAKPRTFDPRIGSSTQRSYWLKLSDVCYDISYMLRCVAGEVEEETSVRRTVYMSAVANDMMPVRDRLNRELTQRGYKVLPGTALPSNSSDIEQVTQKDLEKCVLSIHLIGESYGAILSDRDLSVVALQDEIAHRHTLSVIEARKLDSSLPSFHRLIWLDPDIENIDEMQRIFIEDLKTEAATIEEAEVMEVPLSEFMLIIRNNLARQQVVLPSFSIEDEPDESEHSVYLMHDLTDKHEVESLASLLIDEGLKIKSLSNEGSPAGLRYEHQEHLKTCSACIIYVKKAHLQWFASRLQDLFKAPAFDRKSPMRARAVLFERKIDFDISPLKEYITIINGEQGISSSNLGPFIQAVKNG